jgi:hypothetical protein
MQSTHDNVYHRDSEQLDEKSGTAEGWEGYSDRDACDQMKESNLTLGPASRSKAYLPIRCNCRI